MSDVLVARIINIVICILEILAIILNAFGIYILHISSNGGSNQIQLIISLSFSDICISVMTLCMTILSLIGHSLPDSATLLYVWSQRASMSHAWYLMYFLLTLDRLFGGNFPFKYRAYATKKRLKIILGICWITSLAVGPTFCLPVFELKKVYLFCNTYLWLSYDTLFLALFIVTYASILYRKVHRDEQFRRANAASENQRFFLVTTSLLVAFIILEVFPSIISSILSMRKHRFRNLEAALIEFAWQLNIVADPIIYIFLQPVVRQTAAERIRHLLRFARRVEDNQARNAGSSSQGE